MIKVCPHLQGLIDGEKVCGKKFYCNGKCNYKTWKTRGCFCGECYLKCFGEDEGYTEMKAKGCSRFIEQEVFIFR